MHAFIVDACIHFIDCDVVVFICVCILCVYAVAKGMAAVADVVVDDGAGGTATATATALLGNTVPTVDSVTLEPVAPIATREPVRCVVSASDLDDDPLTTTVTIPVFARVPPPAKRSNGPGLRTAAPTSTSIPTAVKKLPSKTPLRGMTSAKSWCA